MSLHMADNDLNELISMAIKTIDLPIDQTFRVHHSTGSFETQFYRLHSNST